MILTFRAQKMIDRAMREGKGDLLDEETLAMIRSLDGEPANDYNWQSVAMGEPLALIAANDKHPQMYVNVCDSD